MKTKKKTCPHKSTCWRDHYRICVSFKTERPVDGLYRTCWSCHEVLPLGPAKMDGPNAAAVAADLRAIARTASR